MGSILRLLPIPLLLLLAAPSAVRAEPLVADLSNHLIAITTGFTGANVLLFGATDGPGDIVAVVRGPTGRAIVRRKERLRPISMRCRTSTPWPPAAPSTSC